MKNLSLETIKRSVTRALLAGLTGAISAFIVMPVDLTDSKRYIYSLAIAMIAGFLMGLQKFIGGYIKYDMNK